MLTFGSICKITAADQSQAMQDQMSGAAGNMPQDPKAAFKAEWEALEITAYQNALEHVEQDFVAAGPQLRRK